MAELVDELDLCWFTCNKCGKEFRAIDGTWLPIGYEEPNFMAKLSADDDEPPTVYAWDLRPPEIITSDEFTCYDCL